MPDSAEVILVTGAAGFIGSHTAEALLARGARVVGVDNFDTFYDPEIKLRNARALGEGPHADRFTLVEGDICDADAMAHLFADHGFTGVIHLAARAGVRPSIEQPALYARVNVEGTTVLLEEARKSDACTRFVQASSSSVYGNNTKVPFSEDDDVNAPISPYAATKRACELIASTYNGLYGLPIASLRFFTVYGPRQRLTSPSASSCGFSPTSSPSPCSATGPPAATTRSSTTSSPVFSRRTTGSRSTACASGISGAATRSPSAT